MIDINSSSSSSSSNNNNSNNNNNNNNNNNSNVFEINSSIKPYFTCIGFVISLIFICSSKNIVTKHLPIGRAGSSIIGATLMVYFGIIQPKEIGSVINWDTIILLMSMMMLSNYMEQANIWGMASKILLWKCKSTSIFMVRVCLISSIMSSILTNDTVCVTLTPIVISACKSTNLTFFPFLMAIATSANIGSSALPVGNPQNMIIATAGGLNFFNFFKVSIVSSILGVCLNTILLLLYFKKDLKNLNSNFNQLIETVNPKVEEIDNNHHDDDGANNQSKNEKEMENINKEVEEEQHNNDDDDDDGFNENKNNNNNGGHAILLVASSMDSIDLSDCSIINKDKKKKENFIEIYFNSKEKSIETIVNIIKLIFKFRVAIILTLVLIGFFIGMHMGFTVLFGVSILMICERKDITDIINSVDWELLLFFSGLFVLVEGFDRQFEKEAWTILEPFVPIDSTHLNVLKIFIFSILILVLCNILGNVPLVLSLSPRLLEALAPDFTWILLAFVSTVAGNLTLVGSVANLIVAEKSKSYHEIGFLEYLKFGVPSTILVILIGVPIVVLIGK
nr:arsenite transport subunit B [Dictyostelium discoideum]